MEETGPCLNMEWDIKPVKEEGECKGEFNKEVKLSLVSIRGWRHHYCCDHF